MKVQILQCPTNFMTNVFLLILVDKKKKYIYRLSFFIDEIDDILDEILAEFRRKSISI